MLTAIEDGLSPEIYIVLRTISINGVVIERGRYIKNFANRTHAEAFVSCSNGKIDDAMSESSIGTNALEGIDIRYYLKGDFLG